MHITRRYACRAQHGAYRLFANQKLNLLKYMIDREMKDRISAREYKSFGQKTSKAKPRQLESELQKQCVRWFRMQYPKLLLFAVPNGGSRNTIEAARLKAEGVVSGVSDLILLCASGIFHGLAIEMKIGKNKQSPNQINFQLYCIKHNYKYAVCYSFEEFVSVVSKYLKND